MSFQAPYNITSMRELQMAEAQQQQRRDQAYQQQILNGMSELAGAYGDYMDQKNELAGMDKTAMAMKDSGIIDQDTLTKYLNAPGQERSFLFQNFLAPQMGAYNAGRSAAFQKRVWDQGNQGVGAVPGANNQYGYVYRRPGGP